MGTWFSIENEMIVSFVKENLTTYSLGGYKNPLIGKFDSSATNFFHSYVSYINSLVTLGFLNMIA